VSTTAPRWVRDPLVSQFPCDVDAVAGLSLGDLLLLQRHLNLAQQLPAHEQVFCDVDLDGAVKLGDFQQLQRQLLGQ
jgi:Dockerin type I domain